MTAVRRLLRPDVRSAAPFVLGGLALGLLLWTAYLSVALPERHVSLHWPAVWIGLNTGTAVSAALTLVALRRSPGHVVQLASIAGTFLLCDAWFDVLTATAGDERFWAVLLAVLLELPLAGFCYLLAWAREGHG